jgi:hypothetical protein
MKTLFFSILCLFFVSRSVAQNQVELKTGYEFYHIINRETNGHAIYRFTPHYAFGIGIEKTYHLKKERVKFVLNADLVQRSFYYAGGSRSLGGANYTDGEYNVTLLRLSPRYDFFIQKNLSIGIGLAGTYAFLPIIKGDYHYGGLPNIEITDIKYKDAFYSNFGVSSVFSAKYAFKKWGIQLIHYNNWVASKTTAINLTYLIRGNK